MDKAEKYINDYTRNCSNELCSVQDRYDKEVDYDDIKFFKEHLDCNNGNLGFEESWYFYELGLIALKGE